MIAMNDETKGIIKREGNKFILLSHKGEKLFGPASRKAVVKREREINFLKNKGKANITIARGRPNKDEMERNRKGSSKRGKMSKRSRSNPKLNY